MSLRGGKKEQREIVCLNVCAGLLRHLVMKVRELSESSTVSKCIARGVDKLVCQQVLDQVECKQRLLVWSRDGRVCDIFLLSDPGQTHDEVAFGFGEDLKMAAFMALGKACTFIV